MPPGRWRPLTLGVLVVGGTLTLFAHAFHLLGESPLAAILTGVLPPALISVVLLVAAWRLSLTAFPDRCYRRILLWTVLGTLVLTGLGTALMAYEVAHGGQVTDAPYIVVNWVATGALIGFLVGYYDARRVEVETELRRERNRLSEREAQLERENERLDRFASIVSHDLRNPLNVAAGRLELARETGDDEHLAAVADAHERMETIIREMLELAREGADVDAESLDRVSLADVAEESWTGVETDGAALDVVGDRYLRADRTRLRHVFENLFRNAVEHGSTSPPSAGDTDVTVRVGPLEDGTGFFVADDGQGIDDDLDLFEAGVSTAEGGTGLGLAIVREIVRAHGWTVSECGSAAGGARFEIQVPDRDCPETQP